MNLLCGYYYGIAFLILPANIFVTSNVVTYYFFYTAVVLGKPPQKFHSIQIKYGNH